MKFIPFLKFIFVVGHSTIPGDCTIQTILDDVDPNEEDGSCVTSMGD